MIIIKKLIFQQFIRIKGISEYSKNEIIPENVNKVTLEKSLPIVPFENKIYIFTSLEELYQFYNKKQLHVKSITFYGKKINNHELDKISDYAKKNYAFDLYLQVEITKKESIDFKQLLTTTNTINEALEKLYPKGSEDKFFVVDGQILVDKSESASKYSSKQIEILDIKEKTITLEFHCKEFHIDSILITKENIQIMNSLTYLKEEIINITKINRKVKYLIVNKEKNILITDEMLNVDTNIIIPMDVIFKPARFIIKTDNGSKKNFEFTCESIKCLENKYKCDKIQLFDDDIQLDDDANFINLNPSKEYKVLLFDKYFLSKPKFVDHNVDKETIEIYLQRFKTFKQNFNNKFKGIPFLIFYGEKDMTGYNNKKIITTSKVQPLIMKINYKFHIKKGIDSSEMLFKVIDKFDINVKEYIANEIYQLTTTDRVEARIKNSNDETIKIIGNDDTFNNLYYKEGYIIETLLPPNLKFIFDQTNLTSIQFKSERYEKFKMWFSVETTAAEAKKRICRQLGIENDILLFKQQKDIELDDKTLMFNIPESCKIIIKPTPSNSKTQK